MEDTSVKALCCQNCNAADETVGKAGLWCPYRCPIALSEGKNGALLVETKVISGENKASHREPARASDDELHWFKMASIPKFKVVERDAATFLGCIMYVSQIFLVTPFNP